MLKNAKAMVHRYAVYVPAIPVFTENSANVKETRLKMGMWFQWLTVHPIIKPRFAVVVAYANAMSAIATNGRTIRRKCFMESTANATISHANAVRARYAFKSKDIITTTLVY